MRMDPSTRLRAVPNYSSSFNGRIHGTAYRIWPNQHYQMALWYWRAPTHEALLSFTTYLELCIHRIVFLFSIHDFNVVDDMRIQRFSQLFVLTSKQLEEKFQDNACRRVKGKRTIRLNMTPNEWNMDIVTYCSRRQTNWTHESWWEATIFIDSPGTRTWFNESLASQEHQCPAHGEPQLCMHRGRILL